MRCAISWSDNLFGPRVCGYVVFASRDRDQRGRKMAEVCRKERIAYIDLTEGTWFITVLQKYVGCSIEDWKRIERLEFRVSGRERALGSRANACVGAVDAGMSGMVVADPRGDDEPRSITEVIEGESGHPMYRKLVTQQVQYPYGVMQEMGRTPGVRGPLDDHVKAPAGSSAHWKTARTLFIHRRGVYGAIGGVSEMERVIPERAGFMDIAIAEVDTVGGTSSGFPAPLATDPFDYNAAAGFRTRALPAQSDAATYANFGAVGGPGAFFDMAHLTPYFQEAYVPTIEADLGSDQVFILECADSVRRPKVSPAASSEPWADARVDTLSTIPMMPQDRGDHQDRPRDFGPHYLMREWRQVGDPVHPLRFIRWEVRADTVSRISTSWEPYVPGKYLRGRYVQARLRLFDETGWSQVISGDVSVRVRVPRRVYSGQVAWVPSAAWPGVPVALPVHPVTGGALFPNQMHVVATAHGQGGVPSIVTVQGAAAGAAGFNVMVWAAGGASQPVAETVDFIVTGF